MAQSVSSLHDSYLDHVAALRSIPDLHIRHAASAAVLPSQTPTAIPPRPQSAQAYYAGSPMSQSSPAARKPAQRFSSPIADDAPAVISQLIHMLQSARQSHSFAMASTCMNALIQVIPTLLNGQHEQGAAATTQRVLDGLKRPDLASDFDEWASPNHSESAPQSNAKAPSAWQLQIASLVEQLLVDNISTCSQTHLDMCVKLLLAVGASGVSVLLALLSRPIFTQAQEHRMIDCMLRNSAVVQTHIVTPILIRELSIVTEQAAKNAIVMALGRLYDRAVLAAPALVQCLLSGAVPRSLSAWALRCLGHIGQSVLLTCLTHDPHPQIRAAAVYALSVPLVSPHARPPYLEVHVQDWLSEHHRSISFERQVPVASAFAERRLLKHENSMLKSASSAAIVNNVLEMSFYQPNASQLKLQMSDDAEGAQPTESNQTINYSFSLSALDTADDDQPIKTSADSSKQMTIYVDPVAVVHDLKHWLQRQSLMTSFLTPQTHTDAVAINSVFSPSSSDSGQPSSPQPDQQGTDSDQNQSIRPFDRVVLLGIRESMRDHSVVVREAAVRACQQVFALAHQYRSETMDVSTGPAAGTIDRQAERELLWACMICLSDHDRSVVLAVLQALPTLASAIRRVSARSQDQQTSLFANCLHAVSLLLHSPAHSIRAAAITVVPSLACELTAQKMCEPLLKLFRTGAVARSEAGLALVSLRRRGIEALISVLTDEHAARGELRAAAALSLADIDPMSPFCSLVLVALNRARSDRSAAVRCRTLESFQRLWMSSNDQIPALTSRSLLPVFYAALKDPDQSVRHAAATLMASFDAAGELLLVEALLKDESSLVRVAAAHGLLACGPRALRTLLLGLRDDDADVKQAVAQSLLRLETSAIVTYVQRRTQQQTEVLLDALQSAITMLAPMLQLKASPTRQHDAHRLGSPAAQAAHAMELLQASLQRARPLLASVSVPSSSQAQGDIIAREASSIGQAAALSAKLHLRLNELVRVVHSVAAKP